MHCTSLVTCLVFTLSLTEYFKRALERQKNKTEVFRINSFFVLFYSSMEQIELRVTQRPDDA
jgi:hypothetical protein